MSPVVKLGKPPLPFYLLCRFAQLLGDFNGNAMPSGFLKLCAFNSWTTWFSYYTCGYYSGHDLGRNDVRKASELISHGVGDVSWKLLRHLAQGTRAGVAQHYDYGKKRNLVKYGQETPPQYVHANLTYPNVNVICSISDRMIRISDLRESLNQFSNVKNLNVITVKDEEYCHMNFMFGKKVGKLANRHAVNLIKFYEKDYI